MPAITILSSGLPVAILDDFQTMDWTRPYWTAGKFTLTVDPLDPACVELIKGRIILPPDSNICYVIEQILREDDGPNSKQLLTLQGRDLGGYFQERVALPTAGLDYDAQLSVAAETAMKHYVNLNAGPGAIAQRQIPSLVVAADAAHGATVNVQARYQYLSDLLFQIGQIGGLGWQILYNSGTFTFDVIPGVDRSASVFFDRSMDTSTTQAWLTSDVGTKNYDYVGGQGVGAARTIVSRFTGGTEPTGLSRRELWVDARDLSDATALQTRGDTELTALSVPDTFDVTIPTASTFKYRTDWDLGDLVSVRNAAWGLSQTSRIIGVELKLGAGNTSPDTIVTMGRPFPALVPTPSGGGGGPAIDTASTVDTGSSGGGVSLATTTPTAETSAVAGAVGTGTTAARADHVHGMPALLALTATTPTAETYGAAGAVGTSTTAAKADHVHGMPTAPDFSPYAPLAGATFTGAVVANAGLSAPNAPAFRAHKSTTQSFPSATNTQATFDVSDIAVGTGYSTATSVFTAPNTGWYSVEVGVTMTAPTTATRCTVDLWVNGAVHTRLSDATMPTGNNQMLPGTGFVSLTVGDLVKVVITPFTFALTSASPSSATCFFTMRQIA